MLTTQELNDLIWTFNPDGDNTEALKKALDHLEEADWYLHNTWRKTQLYFEDDLRIAYNSFLSTAVEEVMEDGQYRFCHRSFFAACLLNGEGALALGPTINSPGPAMLELCRREDGCVRSLQGLPRLGFYESCPARHAAENLNTALLDKDYQNQELIWMETGVQFKDDGPVAWCLDTEDDYTERSIYPCIRCLSHMYKCGVKTLVFATEEGITVHSVEEHLKVLVVKNVLTNNN